MGGEDEASIKESELLESFKGTIAQNKRDTGFPQGTDRGTIDIYKQSIVYVYALMAVLLVTNYLLSMVQGGILLTVLLGSISMTVVVLTARSLLQKIEEPGKQIQDAALFHTSVLTIINVGINNLLNIVFLIIIVKIIDIVNPLIDTLMYSNAVGFILVLLVSFLTITVVTLVYMTLFVYTLAIKPDLNFLELLSIIAEIVKKDYKSLLYTEIVGTAIMLSGGLLFGVGTVITIPLGLIYILKRMGKIYKKQGHTLTQ